MDRLQAVSCFIAVAERGSFTQAAKFLGIPPSSVSRRIQELESSLGTVLVHRTTRTVSLTELGVVYLEHIRPAVAALEYADELVSADPSEPSGTLRISASPDYGRVCVLPALSSFSSQYPRIVLDIELTDHVSSLENNDVDLAIRATGTLPLRSVARKLSDNQFLLVASPAYIEQHGQPANLQALESHKTLTYRRPDGLLHWHAKTGAGWVDVKTNSAFISNQGSALVDQALAGVGIALVPDWGVAQHVAAGELVSFALADAEVAVSRSSTSGIYLLYRQPKYGLQKVKVAVDFLIRYLGSE